MLLELFRSLADGFPALNVFNYLTLRAVLAALTSMGIGFALGPWTVSYTHLTLPTNSLV